MRSRNVRAIVSYEPGSGFTFPEGEVPPPMTSSGGTLEATGVPMKDFLQLTKIPIVLYYGDNIPEQVSGNPGQDAWRVRLAMARLWVEAVNSEGGSCPSRSPARYRHPRQHAFSLLGSQQHRDRRPSLRVSYGVRPG